MTSQPAASPRSATATGPHRDPQALDARVDQVRARDAQVRDALAYLLRSTQARPQTEAELRAKLRSREVADDVADQVMTRATELGAVDDAAFARAWVQDRGDRRGYAASRLRRELTGRGVPAALVDDALALLDGRDDWQAALELARARSARLPARLPPETGARRLVGYLVRRGYPPALAQRVAMAVTGLDTPWD